MKKEKKLFILLLVLFFLLGHLAVRLANKEFWPFSNYPMYSHIFKTSRINYLEIWATKLSGESFKLHPSQYFYPYNDRSLEESFSRQRDKQRRYILLQSLYTWYQNRRLEKGWPEIKFLGLYQLGYDFTKLKKSLNSFEQVQFYRSNPEDSTLLQRYPNAFE